jgi:hypothetical protein
MDRRGGSYTRTVISSVLRAHLHAVYTALQAASMSYVYRHPERHSEGSKSRVAVVISSVTPVTSNDEAKSLIPGSYPLSPRIGNRAINEGEGSARLGSSPSSIS